MGFMQQFRPQQPMQQPSPQAAMMRDRIGMLRSLVGGNPQAVVEQLSKSNAMCRFPNGQSMPVSQVLQQCQGKSPEEAFKQFGLDYSQIRPLM